MTSMMFSSIGWGVASRWGLGPPGCRRSGQPPGLRSVPAVPVPSTPWSPLIGSSGTSTPVRALRGAASPAASQHTRLPPRRARPCGRAAA